MGKTVWVSGTRNTRVHDRPDCRGFAMGHATDVVERPLAEIHNPLPCKWCWPQAPRLRVWHPTCKICNQTRPLPCPHNGAVQVYQTRKGQWTGRVADSDYDPDVLTYVRRWVWPEHAYRYTLVDSAH